MPTIVVVWNHLQPPHGEPSAVRALKGADVTLVLDSRQDLPQATDREPRDPAFWRHVRTTKRNPCPKCLHHGWCCVFPDGAVFCGRVESDHWLPNAGCWLHWPDDKPEEDRRV